MRTRHPGTWDNLDLDKIVPYREVEEACSELKVRTPEALSDATRLDAAVVFRLYQTRGGWQQNFKLKRRIREAELSPLGQPAGLSKGANMVQVPESEIAVEKVAIRSPISMSEEFVNPSVDVLEPGASVQHEVREEMT